MTVDDWIFQSAAKRAVESQTPTQIDAVSLELLFQLGNRAGRNQQALNLRSIG